jgi:hypothetical protein
MFGRLLLGLAFASTLTMSARPDKDRDQGNRDKGSQEKDCIDSQHHEDNLKTLDKLVGVIPIPGNPVTSADIAWVDPGTERYFIADRANAGVDVIDADDDVWVGRIGGMVGVTANNTGGTATTNGPGPNGVVVTPNRRLWAGDGNSMVQVADVDPNSASYLTILKPGGISTVTAAQSGVCDGGSATTHYCGRADELAYDPADHIIMVANNAPLSLNMICQTAPPSNPAPHCPVDPFATFINADFPYNILGQVTFKGAGGLEQPLWDSELRRFLVTVPGQLGVTPATIQVFNPKALSPNTPAEAIYALNCGALAGAPNSVNITGIALAPFQHILVSACGFPIILTLNAATHTINPINVIGAVGGGDEVWYNPGDGRFYVTGAATLGGVQSLGVIDAETSSLLQIVPDVRGKNPAAFPENNHVFTVVQITTAIAAGTAPDDSVCNTKFGFKGTGCVAVFEHVESGETQAE